MPKIAALIFSRSFSCIKNSYLFFLDKTWERLGSGWKELTYKFSHSCLLFSSTSHSHPLLQLVFPSHRALRFHRTHQLLPTSQPSPCVFPSTFLCLGLLLHFLFQEFIFYCSPPHPTPYLFLLVVVVVVYAFLLHCYREGSGNPLQYSCLENPVDRGAWWAAVHRVTQSRTRLKRLSMHACIGEGNGNPLQCSRESQGQRSLVGCRLWARTESDTTKATQQQQQLHYYFNRVLKKERG